MQPAVLVRLRPLGPWRSGPGTSPGNGDRDSVDSLFRSDRLFSALTLAFADLGLLDDWLNATVRVEKPTVRLGSLFPFQAETLFATPPNTLWPPPSQLVTSPSPLFLSKLRWSHARFVPITLIQSLLTGQPALADQWVVDAESACLLRRDRPSASPFRHAIRRRTAVDRLNSKSNNADTVACVEFEATAGLWTAITYLDRATESVWGERVEGAFRLLADSGFGGGRRIGWGQVAPPQFQRGTWPGVLLPKLSNVEQSAQHSSYWLLSLYSPSSVDSVDWKSGDYRLVTRGGRTGQGGTTKVARLVEEGSVVSAASDPSGHAVNVAPEGSAHPVYRSGFALSVRLPDLEALMESSAPAEVEAANAPSDQPSALVDSDIAEEASETITTPQLPSDDNS